MCNAKLMSYSSKGGIVMGKKNNLDAPVRYRRRSDCDERAEKKCYNGCKRRHDEENTEWNALESFRRNPTSLDDAAVEQEADQKNKTVQYSEECITVIDSAEVEITSTVTRAAVSLQAALQASIVLVLNISIGDSEKAEKIAQELMQKSQIKQFNYQQTYVKNSRKVTISTTDTDLAVNIQLLLQILVALLVNLDIF